MRGRGWISIAARVAKDAEERGDFLMSFLRRDFFIRKGSMAEDGCFGRVFGGFGAGGDWDSRESPCAVFEVSGGGGCFG